MKRIFLCAAVVALVCGSGIAQSYKVLYSFTYPTNDGFVPNGGLIMDDTGNLYGTTSEGGTAGSGTIFELSPNRDGSWSENILYSFCSGGLFCDNSMGVDPLAGVVRDSGGNLYGTTYLGGNGEGVAYELSPPSMPGGSWTYAVIHYFCGAGCPGGGNPYSSLVFDPNGNLYGTTALGGTGHNDGSQQGGAGVVFELSPSANGWTLTPVYNFCSLPGTDYCPDGAFPLAGVTFDKSGNLYGTTDSGGTSESEGYGTVYKLSPRATGWTETILHAFKGPPEAGQYPQGKVALDPEGNVYSTVSQGGSGADGAVFELKVNGSGRSFSFNSVNGANPYSGVTVDSKRGVIYGTTPNGVNGSGGLFQIDRTGKQTILYTFCSQPNCTDGAGPRGDLLEDSEGNLYGTTRNGGDDNVGVVFEITP